MRLLVSAGPVLRTCSAACLLILIVSSSANAGSYTVSGCRSGWVPDLHNTSGTIGIGTQDYCDNAGFGRVLYAALGARIRPTTLATTPAGASSRRPIRASRERPCHGAE